MSFRKLLATQRQTSHSNFNHSILINTDRLPVSNAMDFDEVNTVFFTNLLLLGMDVADMEGRYKIPFNKSMFNLPNKAGSEAVLHFLFNRLNPNLCKEQFRDCWPVSDKKTEMQFRKVCNNWLTQIQKDEVDARLPSINASLLLSPGGRKFVILINKFSTFVLIHVMKTELGFRTELALVYPNLTPNISFLADMTLTSIQDNCLREGEQFFERLHLIIAACKNWKEYIGDMIKEYRRVIKGLKDSEHEKRLEVNVTADSALQLGCSLPAKRAITMFDSGTDNYTALRCQRVAKASKLWRSLSSFHERMEENRKIIRSILDRSAPKHSINGTEMGIRVPGLLLREYKKEIHQKIDNVYTGGVLNLNPVIFLWNVCLKLYIQQLKTESLPDVAPEIPYLSTQAHKLHCHLKSTQEMKDEIRTQKISELQGYIKRLQKTLNDIKSIPLSDKHNDIGLGLTVPSPSAAPFTKKPTHGQTPTGPIAATSSNKNTPDTVLQTSYDVESTVAKVTLAPLPKLNLRSLSSHGNGLQSTISEGKNTGGLKQTKSAVKQPTKMKVPEKAPHHTNPKSQQRNKPVIRKPLAYVRQDKQSSSSVSSSVSSTPRTSKQKAVDLLVDEVVGAVLNSKQQQEDFIDSFSPLQYGILDESVFISRNCIERSPDYMKSIDSKDDRFKEKDASNTYLANLSHLTSVPGTLEKSRSSSLSEHFERFNTSSPSAPNDNSKAFSRPLNFSEAPNLHKSAEVESIENYRSIISEDLEVLRNKMFDRPPGDGQASPDSVPVLASGKPSPKVKRIFGENVNPSLDTSLLSSSHSEVGIDTSSKQSAGQHEVTLTPSLLSMSRPVDSMQTSPAAQKSVDVFSPPGLSPATTPRQENSFQKLFLDLDSSQGEMLQDYSLGRLNQILLNNSDILPSPTDHHQGKKDPDDLLDLSVQSTRSLEANTPSQRGLSNLVDPPEKAEKNLLVVPDLQGHSDSDPELDLDSSYAPVKEGILLSSGNPKEKEPSLEQSDNIQSKLEMLRRKRENIYVGALEDSPLSEGTSPMKLDPFKNETSSQDLLQVPDDEDLLTTELMRTNLLDVSDDLL